MLIACLADDLAKAIQKYQRAKAVEGDRLVTSQKMILGQI